MGKRRSHSSPKGQPLELARDLVVHVDQELDRQTVAQVLKQRLEGISWNDARGLSSKGRVLLNGNLCADHARRLQAGDVLKVLRQPAARPASAADVTIYYADQHVVVFEKPAGVTSIRHAEERGWTKRRRQRQATLDELLPEALDRQQRQPTRRRGPPPRIRMVHRLDRDTSGVMVAARTVAAEQALIGQFKQHSVERTYLAICQGRVEQQTIRTHLVRDRGDGLRGSTSEAALGKLAITHVLPLEQGDGYSLVQCRLETGRTHQIRIHLAELGHPLFGERVYLKRLGERPFRDTSGAPRQALHAAELAFVHPTSGEQLAFKSSLPRDMKLLLSKLREG